MKEEESSGGERISGTVQSPHVVTEPPTLSSPPKCWRQPPEGADWKWLLGNLGKPRVFLGPQMAQGEDLGWARLVITITTAEGHGVWEPGWELGASVSHAPRHHSQGARREGGLMVKMMVLMASSGHAHVYRVPPACQGQSEEPPVL